MTESTDTTTVKTNRKIAFEIYPEDVCIIGLDTDDGPEHPLWDERVALPVNQAMVDNMLLRGWTHGAVELRKNKADKRYEVVVGRQRVKAARTANEQGTDGYERLKVVAFMNDVEDNDAMGLVISENEQRTDDNPMAKADKLKRFMMQGKTIAEAALVFGVSKQTIKLWAKAHKLIGPVQDAVRSGKISFNGALGLADLSEDKQQEALDALPEDGEGQDGNVTKKQIKKLKDEKEGKEHNEKPTTTKIKAVLAAHKEEPFLSDDFVLALKWVLGIVGDNKIKGLTHTTRLQETKAMKARRLKEEKEAAE